MWKLSKCCGIASAALVMGALCGASQTAAAQAAPAKPAAESAATPAGLDFSFSDLSGATHTLSEVRGRTTLLEFWASWCVPCRKGFPFLNRLQERHGPAGLKVVAVTLEEDEAAVREFVSDHPGEFLVGRDPSGHAGELYQVAAMPTSILLDRGGRVMARFEGGTDSVHKDIEVALDKVMRGQSLPPVPDRSHGTAGSLGLRAWERGYLADPIMNLDGDVLTRSMKEHVHTSKEGAAGDGGVAGGGCGCN